MCESEILTSCLKRHLTKFFTLTALCIRGKSTFFWMTSGFKMCYKFSSNEHSIQIWHQKSACMQEQNKTPTTSVLTALMEQWRLEHIVIMSYIIFVSLYNIAHGHQTKPITISTNPKHESVSNFHNKSLGLFCTRLFMGS